MMSRFEALSATLCRVLGWLVVGLCWVCGKAAVHGDAVKVRRREAGLG